MRMVPRGTVRQRRSSTMAGATVSRRESRSLQTLHDCKQYRDAEGKLLGYALTGEAVREKLALNKELPALLVGVRPDRTVRHQPDPGLHWLWHPDHLHYLVAVAPTRLGTKLGIAPADMRPSTSPDNTLTGEPDGNNWAVGGYRTDQILNSIKTESKVAIPDDWALVGGYVLRSKPGYLVQNNFKADPKALYFISGGGNDFLQGKVTSPAEAGQAAQRLAASAHTLQQAGARYIMVWLPSRPGPCRQSTHSVNHCQTPSLPAPGCWPSRRSTIPALVNAFFTLDSNCSLVKGLLTKSETPA